MAIGAAAYDAFDVAHFALDFLRDDYPEVLTTRYKIPDVQVETAELLGGIARGRGFLGRGGRLDIDRAADVLLRELRTGQLGRISFERPRDERR